MFWHLHKIPQFIVNWYPSSTWHRSRVDNKIYLTFDDGPIPEITPWVLDLLAFYQIKATFFCVGDNVDKHTHLVERILLEGHQIGNHTQNHWSAWSKPHDLYMENVSTCQQILKKNGVTSNLFRPPYGRLNKQVKKELLALNYEVIMWDVLTYDFDNHVTASGCLKNSLKATENGSIIVFHDSLKSKDLLYPVLPKYIEACLYAGYQFENL